ncbi:MAG: serine/threonine-protein kinase, partial [Planctomycetota bacterium]
MDSRDDGFQESVDQAFLAACELDRDSRTPYLATLPEQVRKAVEKLLAAADRAGDQFMQPATSGKDSDPRFEATEPGTGDTQKSATRERSNSSTSQLPGAPIIAHHEIQRVIGEGGMGVVYFAIDQTLSREVAVKLLNQRITNPSTKLRFKFECEIAAEMDHPGIASIYASGVTDDGRPYYVMEYIDGLPITVYCDKMRLSLRDRLKLFAEVCDAIHHAHQKGIVHRDLKPGNILVKANQAQPQVKVIDFGLAKSIHEENAQDLTMVGQVIGTLRYMSPEQTYFDIRKTDIRADVFSLGVLLYEMITGDTPISIDEYRRAARDELYRRIREEAPIAPSRSLDKDPKRSSSIAESRGTDSRSLISRVRGDLDWITLKSLRKERDQRYDSASALAGDVRRYLDHLVVSAGPPSLWYRSRKFIRRNRLTVATTLAFLTLIVGSTIGLAFAAHRARAASRLADQRADFLEVQAEELEKRSVSLSKTVDLLQRREAELVAAVEIGYTLLESEQVGQVDPIPEILRLQSRRKSGKRSTNSPDLQARIELFQLLPSVFQLLRQESAVLEFNDPLEAAAKTSELEPLIARYNAILGQLDRIHKLNAELGFAWLIDAEIRTRAASAFDRSGLAQPLLSSLGFKRSSNEEITSAWKETVRRLPKSTYSHSGYAFWAFGLDDFEVAMKHSDLAMQFGPNSLLAI